MKNDAFAKHYGSYNAIILCISEINSWDMIGSCWCVIRYWKLLQTIVCEHSGLYTKIMLPKTPRTIFTTNKSSLGIWLGVSCRCTIRFWKFIFSLTGQIVDEIWRLSFQIKHGSQNLSRNFHNGTSQIIFWNMNRGAL